jgi:uncharacterized protein (DUF2126 family)
MHDLSGFYFTDDLILFTAYLSNQSSSTAVMGAAAVFSVMAALNGGLGLVAKRLKENYHDTAQKDPKAERLPDDIPGSENQE